MLLSSASEIRTWLCVHLLHYKYDVCLQVIVLAPTRELVIQVTKDFTSLSSNLSIHAFYGGVGFRDQGEFHPIYLFPCLCINRFLGWCNINCDYFAADALRAGIDILVGTPGRVLDWINKERLNTSKLEHVVLDEVDQMLDMGFADDVENIISYSYNRGKASLFVHFMWCLKCTAMSQKASPQKSFPILISL